MRLFITCLSIAIFMLIALPMQALGQTRDFSQTVDLNPGGDLTLETNRGTVNIMSWERNQVEIKAVIEAPRDVDREYAEEVLEATRIDVRSTAQAVSIRSDYSQIPEYNRGWGWNNRGGRIPEIHYEIRTPRQVNVDIDVDRNRLTIAGIQGDARIETDRTDVEGRDLTGDLRLDMDRGDLRLDDIRGSFDLETDRTDVRMTVLSLDDRSRISGDRGVIEIRLPETQGFDLFTNLSRRGDVDCEFEITTQRFRRDEIEGSVNGGGPELSIRGDRLRVRLRRL